MKLIYRDEIRASTDKLVKAWETADVSELDAIILPDAVVDFDIFEQGIGKDGLLQKLSERPRPISYTKFEQLNSIVVKGEERAKQSLALIGTFADAADGKWTKYSFGGTFALEFVQTADGWRFSSIKFALTDENVVAWPRLTSDGIGQMEGPGDSSYVSHWISPKHEDRIGWFTGSRLPAINPVYDNPWYGITDRVAPEHEEELVEECFFRYAFGIDFNNFQLYMDNFTDDCQCVYGDTQPYDKRGVVEFLKAERQGSPRCVHVGFFTDVSINGDAATGRLYLRGAQFAPGGALSPEEMNKTYTWARYDLRFKKEDGRWKIHKLNFYSGMQAH